jgi:3-oxoacyl-[acyl-carrier protein] reductase
MITGGGSGIGYTAAAAFIQAGDRVVILGRREDKLRAAAAALGPAASWQTMDVSRRDSVEAAIASTARLGRLDVLVNNAGFVRGVTADTPLAEAERLWNEVLDTNLKGSFLMAMAAAAHLPKPGGRIVNISSIAAFTGGSRPGAVAYAAAKAGVIGMTYGLARELSPHGITVNAIAPGFVAGTEFTGAWSEERIRGIVRETPVGRPGHADDIASAILYLASPAASFVTGTVLHVNGGWLFGH